MSKIKRYLPYIICYSVILFLLITMHNVVSMYFDDFGNASLSYSITVENVIGTKFTFSQLWEHTIYTYNHFGGRVLYGMFASILLRDGASLYMMIQSFIILLIIFFIHQIIKLIIKKDNIIPIILFILYGLIHISILRHGIYWASASILYVWPLLPLFAWIYYFMMIREKIKNNKKINYILFFIINFVLLFFTNFSQEQIGVLQIAFFGIYVLFDDIKNEKKYLKYDIPILLMSIGIYLILFLAPGNYARLDSNTEFASLSFIGKIRTNLPKMFDLLFKVRISDYINIICGLLIMININFIIDNKNNKKYLLLILPILGLLLNFVIYFIKPYDNHKIITIAGMIILLSTFIDMCFIAYKTNKLKYLSFPISAICSVFCLLMAPYTIERQIIPCMFILYLIIIILGYYLIKQDKLVINIILFILFLTIAHFSIHNYVYIYKGYLNNKTTNDMNYKIMSNYKDYIINDNHLDLCKVPNSKFGSLQPYEVDMNWWIQQYFDIPENIEFDWNDCYE